jgi:3',5'-cyclic AMP phosphodiesterase CpdA
VVLNSNCRAVGGCFAGSEQERWLAADLAAHPAKCTLAYWHHPLFTSDSQTGRATNTQPLWDDLSRAGAELVLNGHAHEYERFAPQRPDGAADPAAGIREFVVGVGGRSFSTFASSPAANSQRRDNSTFGVLELTLGDGSYAWQFLPAEDGGFTDSGTQSCH